MAAGQGRRAMRCPYCNSEQGAGSASCSKCSFPFQEPEKQASFLQRKIRLAEAEESNTLELIGKSKYIIYAVALLIAIQTINIFSLLEAGGGLLITIGIFSALLCCGMICLCLDMERHPMRNAVLGLFGTFLAMSANKLGHPAVWGWRVYRAIANHRRRFYRLGRHTGDDLLHLCCSLLRKPAKRSAPSEEAPCII